MMGEIFTSPARPFYQSTAIMELHPIDIGTYTKFIRKHFLIANKDITEETVQNVYERFEGITWYIQFISNSLYAMTATGEICTADKVSIAIENIYQLPPKQKEVLFAICKEGKAREITSSRFLKTYKLTASSVQGAIKGLLDKDFCYL